MNCNDGYLLVIYDLSMASSNERHKYVKFRKIVLGRGYEMVQYSFYKKYLKDLKSADYEIKSLERITPKNSRVHVIKLTTQQALNSVFPIGLADEIISERDFETIVEY